MKIKLKLSLLILVSGCHFVPQQIKIAPNINVIQDNIGSSSDLYVEVVDDRDSEIIGNRGLNKIGADITASPTLIQDLKSSIEGGLRSRGFNIIHNKNGSTKSIRIEVRKLEYEILSEILVSKVRVEFAIKAYAKNDKNTFDKIIRTTKDEIPSFTTTAEMNERVLNEGVSEGIAKLISDNEIIEFLTS